MHENAHTNTVHSTPASDDIQPTPHRVFVGRYRHLLRVIDDGEKIENASYNITQ